MILIRVGRFYLPSGGVPALPQLLFEVCHPVRLLQFGIQFPKIFGEVIDTLLEVVDIDGTNELDFIAGIAVAADVGVVKGGAERGQVHGQDILFRDHFGQGLSLPDGFLVGAVDADDEVLQLLQGAFQFPEEVLRFLGRLVSLLHFHVVGETFPELGDPFLEIRPLVQCFCEFHVYAIVQIPRKITKHPAKKEIRKFFRNSFAF